MILVLSLCHCHFFIREWDRRRWRFLTRIRRKLLWGGDLIWLFRLRLRLVFWEGFFYSYFECIQENGVVFELFTEQFSVIVLDKFAIILISPLVIMIIFHCFWSWTIELAWRGVTVFVFFILNEFILFALVVWGGTVFEFKHIVKVRHNK